MMHGHNENAVRLAALAGDAQIALDKVAKGEADAIDGWLAYGAALNEGRALFASDERFGEWIVSSNLRLSDNDKMERAAAMWAAAHADQFAEARAAGSARTVRGIHAKWKEIEAERQATADRAEAERIAAERRAEAEAAAKAVEASRAAAEANPTPEAKAAVAEAEAISAARKEDLVSATAAIPDPHAAERRKLSKLTREALEDDLIGLRAENAELRVKLAAQHSQLIDLKAENKALRESEGGRTLGNALRQASAAEGRMREHQAAAARLQRQVNAQAAEIARLKRGPVDA